MGQRKSFQACGKKRDVERTATHVVDGRSMSRTLGRANRSSKLLMQGTERSQSVGAIENSREYAQGSMLNNNKSRETIRELREEEKSGTVLRSKVELSVPHGVRVRGELESMFGIPSLPIYNPKS